MNALASVNGHLSDPVAQAEAIRAVARLRLKEGAGTLAVQAELRSTSENLFVPPMGPAEIDAHISAALDEQAAGELVREALTQPNGHREPERSSSERIRWLDVAALRATDPPVVPWVVEPLIARGHLTMLVGAAGVGKSLLALALASAVAHDASVFAGMPVHGGDVVLVDAENGERVLHERAHLVDLPANRVRLGLAEGLDLRDSGDADALQSALEEGRPALLVLDSLASLAPGLKENEADQAGPVVDRLRRVAQTTSTGVVLLHHTRKDGGSYRGGTSLLAAVDVAAVVGRPPDDDDHERRVIDWSAAVGGKMRLAHEPDARHLRVAVRGGRLTVDQAEPSHADAAREEPSRRDVVREQLLTALEASGPLRQGEALRAVGLNADDRTGRRALADAIERGDVTRHEDGRHEVAKGVAGTVPPLAATPMATGTGRQAYVVEPCPASPGTGSGTGTPLTEGREGWLADHEREASS